MTHRFEYGEEYLRYQVSRGWFREKIRQVYLCNIKKYIVEPAVDFGCGAGELLKKMPDKSLGLEVNPIAVNYCKKLKLRVEQYFPKNDDYRFEILKTGAYETFVMCHVLEHMEDACGVFKKILKACFRMRIKTIVLVVPGYKGFLSDKSHQTFINIDYLKKHNLVITDGYELSREEYFPFNARVVGNWFTHNESIFVYEKR